MIGHVSHQRHVRATAAQDNRRVQCKLELNIALSRAANEKLTTPSADRRCSAENNPPKKKRRTDALALCTDSIKTLSHEGAVSKSSKKLVANTILNRAYYFVCRRKLAWQICGLCMHPHARHFDPGKIWSHSTEYGVRCGGQALSQPLGGDQTLWWQYSSFKLANFCTKCHEAGKIGQGVGRCFAAAGHDGLV